MTLKPCIVCGELTDGPRCTEHQRVQTTKPRHQQPHVLGYDYRWRQLSIMARRLQPWCSDCLTREDLTTDHSPEAWARKQAGKAIRLKDVDVVCRGCNARRGRARPEAESSGDMRVGRGTDESPRLAAAVSKVLVTHESDRTPYPSGDIA